MKKLFTTFTAACITLAAHNVSAQAVFTPADRLLRVGTLTIGSEIWTDLVLRLDNDNRLSIVSAKPPATPAAPATPSTPTSTSTSTQWRGVNLA